MGRNELIDVEDLGFVHETDAAIIVEYDGKEISLPKSQIEFDQDEVEKGGLLVIAMPEWLAMDRGLI